MVSPQAKREAMQVIVEYGLSQRRACCLVNIHRSVGRYKVLNREGGLLQGKIISLALERKRFGYRRIYLLLKQEGVRVNHKRVYRLYRESGLKVAKRGGHKRAWVAGCR